jgi:DNA-binding LytR/AlgR family response regulator
VRILIVEDEPPIAGYIERCVRSILGPMVQDIWSAFSLEGALTALADHPVDLCLLDLNLGGRDGYEVLMRATSHRFQTIVVSAHPEQAIRAFELGVIDFVAKPFGPDRMRLALDRYFGRAKGTAATRYLTFRKHNQTRLLPVADVVYLKAARYLVEANLADGRQELLEKPLHQLERILPEQFVRTHRSYLVRLDQVTSFEHKGGSTYVVKLRNGEVLPLSRRGRDRLDRVLSSTT